MKLYGIDISHHNWHLIQENERQERGWLYNMACDGFVMMKATEGRTFDDPRFMDYIKLIGETNIRFDFASAGAYHYARPENNLAAVEARHFVDRIGSLAGCLVLALDVEGRALEYPNIDKWCFEWLEAVKAMTGVKPLVYCQRSALKLFDRVPAGDYGLWLASWQKQCPKNTQVAPWPFMAIWQNNGMGLDTDYFFGNKKQWRKYATGGK